MHLPDLEPDTHFAPLPRTEPAFRLSFEVKRAALGPHIARRWGWDDALQQDLHRRRFETKPFLAIVVAGQDVGTLSLIRADDHIRFGEFYLLPARQGAGMGTRILRHCLALTDAAGLRVRLEYLKWNPVGSLYRRHGFREIAETDTHWYLERRPGGLP